MHEREVEKTQLVGLVYGICLQVLVVAFIVALSDLFSPKIKKLLCEKDEKKGQGKNDGTVLKIFTVQHIRHKHGSVSLCPLLPLSLSPSPSPLSRVRAEAPCHRFSSSAWGFHLRWPGAVSPDRSSDEKI